LLLVVILQIESNQRGQAGQVISCSLRTSLFAQS